MKPEINLITIWTDEIDRMRNFYNQVLGFRIKNDLGNYVEFENNGVRFAICMRNVMYSYSDEYRKKAVGQAFELAFPCENPNDVDEAFKKLVAMGQLLFINHKICHGIKEQHYLQTQMGIYMKFLQRLFRSHFSYFVSQWY